MDYHLDDQPCRPTGILRSVLGLGCVLDRVATLANRSSERFLAAWPVVAATGPQVEHLRYLMHRYMWTQAVIDLLHDEGWPYPADFRFLTEQRTKRLRRLRRALVRETMRAAGVAVVSNRRPRD